MSDQFGNHVDGEVWVPLKAGDWIDKVDAPKPPVFVPLDSWTEYAIAYANGSVDEARFKNEGTARLELQSIRGVLKSYGVPEEAWPVLMERTVEIMSSSWRILSV